MTCHRPSSRRSVLKTLAAVAVLCSVSRLVGCRPKPPPAKPWHELEGCKLVSNKSNDGDSFHVLHEGNEYIFRLYFVDTPETAMDSQMESRIADQAAYFRITTDQALEIGKDAAAFTSKRLSGTFTVYTRFRRAPGRSNRPRYYAVVMVGPDDIGLRLHIHTRQQNRCQSLKTVAFSARYLRRRCRRDGR